MLKISFTLFLLFRSTLFFALSAIVLAGCLPAGVYRRSADKTAYNIVDEGQEAALGQTKPFTIERPEDILRRRLLKDQSLPFASVASLGTKELEAIPHWPDDEYLKREIHPDAMEPVPHTEFQISLQEALMIGAANSREYQTRKEQVFLTALDLDLERDFFRPFFTGTWDSTLNFQPMGSEPTVTHSLNTGLLSVTQNFANGAQLTMNLGIDLVRLMSQDEMNVRGIFGDASITVPLLRGAGKHIVLEPLRQAERNVIYAIHTFERFKREFAVQVASAYLQVLQQLDEVENAEENYRSLILSARRARRLADAGRLPEIQVDQALQDELRARDRWIGAQQNYEARLDSLKVLLGLPTDARIILNRDDFQDLGEETAEALNMSDAVDLSLEVESVPADTPVEMDPASREGGGPLEMEAERAIQIALEKRLDLRNAIGRVFDAQRQVYVAADQLEADVTLGGNGSAGGRKGVGDAATENAELLLDEGTYNAFLTIDLPFERTAERNRYRASLIALEQAVRDLQELEDGIKSQIRDALRTLLESRESVQIQARSVALAERRVESTNLFLQAGRAEIRDLLEAQESLISAQNAYTAAIVNYRVAELEIQRDLGVLEVDPEGIWKELEIVGETQ